MSEVDFVQNQLGWNAAQAEAVAHEYAALAVQIPAVLETLSHEEIVATFQSTAAVWSEVAAILKARGL